MDQHECIVISDATSVQPLCRSRVDLSIIGLDVEDGDDAGVTVGGGEEDPRPLEMALRVLLRCDGLFRCWRSSGEVDDVAAGAGHTTQSSLRHLPVTEVIL